MRNWHQIVRERLASSEAPARDEEVVSELAAHLEETYEVHRAQGCSDADATAYAVQQVADWNMLGKRICRAKSTEALMNPQTKRLWLPAIATLFVAGLLLIFLDIAPSAQRLIWMAEMVMLLRVAVLESNHLGQTTRRFWLPGFVSMTTASFILLAADTFTAYDPSRFFTEIGLRPQSLLAANSGRERAFYFVWLLAQVLSGALGAFLSRRAGGTRKARIVAGAFPAITLFGLCVVLVPLTFLMMTNALALPDLADVARAGFVWMVPPAIAVLSGAALFLKEPAPSAVAD